MVTTGETDQLLFTGDRLKACIETNSYLQLHEREKIYAHHLGLRLGSTGKTAQEYPSVNEELMVDMLFGRDSKTGEGFHAWVAGQHETVYGQFRTTFQDVAFVAMGEAYGTEMYEAYQQLLANPDRALLAV